MAWSSRHGLEDEGDEDDEDDAEAEGLKMNLRKIRNVKNFMKNLVKCLKVALQEGRVWKEH